MKETYYRPETIEETLELLYIHKEEIPYLLAGGTDIMVKRREEELNTNKHLKNIVIIDINRLKNNIGKIEINGDRLEIGALATYTDILESKITLEKAPIISKSAFFVGGRQIQNMGTIGGMLGTSTPAADVSLSLLVTDADVILRSKNDNRKVHITEFFTGYRQTARKPDELIFKISVPFQAKNEKTTFQKVGGRRGQVIAISSFCGRLILTNDNIIEKAFLSVGSSSPCPIRLYELEKYITNKHYSSLKKNEEKRELIEIIDKSISPIDEVIATAEYKRHCVKNLILDFLCERV
jgi:CO/xanthine dehydrogenase FAD-binding subunit